MNDTKIVREACKHGKYEYHLAHTVAGRVMALDVPCPGGKEITLTQVVAIFLQLPSGTEQEISLHSSSARMWAEVDGND